MTHRMVLLATRLRTPAAWRGVLVTCVWVMMATFMPTAVGAQSSGFRPPESSPVTESWSRLTSESLGLAERAAAATELLVMDNDEATGALSLALTTQQSRIGWRAVIQAVATYPESPPKDLAQPLIGLLGRSMWR